MEADQIHLTGLLKQKGVCALQQCNGQKLYAHRKLAAVHSNWYQVVNVTASCFWTLIAWFKGFKQSIKSSGVILKITKLVLPYEAMLID